MPHSDDRYMAFAEAYLTPESDTFFNITQSAIAAGYSKKYANTRGQKLLGAVRIEKALEKVNARLKKKANKTGTIATPENMLQMLTQLLYFNPKNLVNKKGQFKKLHQIDDETAMCLTAYEVYKGGVKYKWADKVTIIKTIFDSLGLKNGNKDLVDEVVNRIFNLNVQVNVDGKVANEAMKLLIDGAAGITRGIPSQNVISD